MKDEKRAANGQPPQPNGSLPNRILGSLRDALNAASRDDRSGEISIGGRTDRVSGKAPPEAQKTPAAPAAGRPPEIPVVASHAGSTSDAVRDAKGVTRDPRHFEAGSLSSRLSMSQRSAGDSEPRRMASTSPAP